MPPANAPTIFTAAEIEKMRLYVTEHDKQSTANKVFDLNNPPRTSYVHQHFPRLLYKLHPEGHQVHKKVDDAEEHKAALADGWSNEPVAAPEPDGEIPLDAAAAAEAAALDKRLAELRKKKNGKNGK